MRGAVYQTQVRRREAVEREEGPRAMQETQKQGRSARRDSGRVVVAQFRQTVQFYKPEPRKSANLSRTYRDRAQESQPQESLALSPDAAAGMELIPECSKQQARGHIEL